MDSQETAGTRDSITNRPQFSSGTMAQPQFPLNFQTVFPLLYYKGVLSLDMSPSTCSPSYLGRIPSVGTASLQYDLQLPSFKGKDRETAVLAQPAPGLRRLESHWVHSARARACFNLCIRDCVCGPRYVLGEINPLSCQERTRPGWAPSTRQVPAGCQACSQVVQRVKTFLFG